MREKSENQSSLWKKTNVPNLIRYEPSGTYYLRARVAGKLFQKSLETTVFSVAKLRLADELKKRRAAAATAREVAAGRMTFAESATLYRTRMEANARLKPKSKRYYGQVLDGVLKTWPGTGEKDISKITVWECQQWLLKFQTAYAASVVNNAIAIVRTIFDQAVETGARLENPTLKLKRVPAKSKPPKLPSWAEFNEFVASIETAGARQSRDCAAFVRFLAYSGLRIGEAKHLTWDDIDLHRSHLVVNGDPETGTKNGEVRRVPMIPELKALVLAMREQRADEPGSARVLRVAEATNSMKRAAKVTGIAHLRHHDLRHLFATVCIESGVDIPTVSKWLGHKDGGALAMRVYGHLRADHSALQATKVRFAPATVTEDSQTKQAA